MATSDLFSQFPPSTSDEWKSKIEKDLRGKDYNSLLSKTRDGINIHPFYHRSQLNLSGQPFKSMAKWDSCQEIVVKDARTANGEALDHLNRGATSLLFHLNSDIDLSLLLKNIQIEFIRTNFIVKGDALKLAQNFIQLIENRGLQASEVAGSVNTDPLGALAYNGKWEKSEEEDLEVLTQLNQLLPTNMRGLCVNANLFGNAGGSLSQQLGIALSMAYEYIHKLNLADTQNFSFTFAIGSDYFGEIAKLRAFRRLWQQLNTELGLEPNEAFIFAETALRNKTILDAYNNMIRTTSESMAAAIGGANEISVKGFNQTFKSADFFGERIAKNQQNILEHESHINAVVDISRGSYFVESLTEELSEKAWEFFKEIEAQGGYISALENSWLQNQIEATANLEQADFDAKKTVLIGANKYAKSDENLKEIIENGMFSENVSPSGLKRIIPKRLSEKLEV